MDIGLFKTFLLVAELLNITRASEQLSFSQPAITAQICSLEDAFRVKLFERTGKRLTLTDAGKKMIDYAQRIVSLYEETQNVMATFSHASETIRLGVSTQMINYFLPFVLKELQGQMPSLNISVEICMNTQDVLKGILECRYDFGFIHGENTFKQIRQHGIWTEDVLWVASQEFIKNNEVKDNNDLPVINYTVGSVLRGKLDELTGNEDLQSPIEYSDSEAIKRAVIAGLGISYLPTTLIKDEIAIGKLIVLEREPLIQLQISLVYHHDKTFTLPMYALLLALANQPGADKTIKELL
ncbi:LysR family transcriptional regulator [Pelosinus sp. UFO1]|uniref:LysR family transcriptional regulator n=1 Tax=Pelosinus sp. UFO1 TaxID=484770 RepID=UPI00130E5E87|nr:LysR family transcriptional regulator [Pelosinus sp. UFO1]